MNDNFNRNDKQRSFNEIKGKLTEINEGEKFCSVTLEIGHERPRLVNMVVKKQAVEDIKQLYNVGDKVTITFYITSRKNGERWSTMANVLNIALVN